MLRALAAGLTLMVALTLVGGGIADAAYRDRALPGIHFEAVPLGGLTHAQVKGVLETQLHSFRSAPVVFAYETRQWEPEAEEMGLYLDLDGMAAEAVRRGRDAPPVLRYFTSVAAIMIRPEIPLKINPDSGQLHAFLSAVAAEIDREPANAALSVRNGQLVVGQPAPGRRVDREATAQRVVVPRTATQSRVDVVTTSVPPAITSVGVQEAQAAAQRILSAPLTLRLGERSWTLSPAALGGMIDVQRVPAVQSGAGAPAERLMATLNEARVAGYVKQLAAEIDRPAISAQLRWTGNGAQVTREATDGLKLDQAAAVRAIMSQAAQEHREVALTTSIVKAQVTSDATTLNSIKQLVATGSSRFAGSSVERVNNIQVAAAKLDGIVVAPGATFSFLSALGPITKDAGYMEGLTIVGDATVPGIGGGVCQVSTTIFRAAFFAGVPIVERHQHTYRVGYYEQDGSPVGFDAAVYDPGVDFRFRNDTEHAILIHSAVDPATSTISFNFYSTPAAREIKLAVSRTNDVKAGPRLPDTPDPTLPKGVRKQVEWSADGADATIRRTVALGGQTLFTDAFFSRYAPWREKWVIGTG